MTVYVILECAQTYEGGCNHYPDAFYPNRFLALAKSEEEARSTIESFAEDRKNFLTAMDSYLYTHEKDPDEFFPNGAICIESEDTDVYYYYKTVDI